MKTHRLLVLALAPFGDAALLAGPLAARRAARPGERVTVAASPGVCDVVRTLGLAETCWEVGPSPAPARALGLYRTAALLVRANRGRFDAVVDLFPHMKSVVASRLATPGRGASRPGTAVDALLKFRAKVQGAYDPTERMAMMLEVDAEGERPRFAPDPVSDAWIERSLEATGYRGGEPVVVVHSEGHWPSDRFIEVADRLRSGFGARIVVVDTPREGRRARAIAGALGGTVLGVVTPPAGRFIAALARASLVLTDDAGVAHVSGLVRAPVLLVSAGGRPLPPPRPGYRVLTAVDYAGIEAASVFDLACKVVRRERSGPLFHG